MFEQVAIPVLGVIENMSYFVPPDLPEKRYDIFGTGGGRYGVLAVCTLLAAGVFGLLRMRRWGWAIATAGALLLASGYVFLFTRTHGLPYLVQALFGAVFFLYLVRSDVRERMR